MLLLLLVVVPPIVFKSPGSENALPGSITLSTLNHHPSRPAVKPLPKIRIRSTAAASSRPTAPPPPPALPRPVPLPPTPSRGQQLTVELMRSPTRPKTMSMSTSSGAHPGQRSPKKKKMADGTARYVVPAITDDEENLGASSKAPSGLLFGPPRIENGTQLDGAHTSSSQETLVDDGDDMGSSDTSRRSPAKAKRPAPPRLCARRVRHVA